MFMRVLEVFQKLPLMKQMEEENKRKGNPRSY